MGFSDCGPDIVKQITTYDKSKDNLAYNVIPILTILLASCAIIINIVFCYLVIFALRNRILPFRGYSLMLNRSFTDLFVSICTVIFISLHRTKETKDIHSLEVNDNRYEVEYLIPHGRTLFTLLLTVDYWAVAGAYGVLAILPYLAVQYPWFYRQYITDRRTVMIMVAVWIVGSIYSILVVALSSNNAFNVFNERTDLIQWSVSTEDYVLAIANLIILILAFILVTGSYTATILFLWRKSNGKILAGVHFTSIKRMALNIVAFAATCFVMTGFVGLPLFLSSHIVKLQQLNTESKCKEALHAFKLSYQIIVWTAFAMAGWLVRMSFDPISTFLLDDRFKKVMTQAALCCGAEDDKGNTPTGLSIKSNQRPMGFSRNGQNTMISFVQKCSDLKVMPGSVSGQYFRFRTPTFIAPPSPKRKNHIRFDDLIL